jgi:hypothetical protein
MDQKHDSLDFYRPLVISIILGIVNLVCCAAFIFSIYADLIHTYFNFQDIEYKYTVELPLLLAKIIGIVSVLFALTGVLMLVLHIRFGISKQAMVFTAITGCILIAFIGVHYEGYFVAKWKSSEALWSIIGIAFLQCLVLFWQKERDN